MGLLGNGAEVRILFDDNNGLSFYVFIFFGYHGKEGSWEDGKKQKNLCNLRNLWFLFFIRLRAIPTAS
jgi:hypothetical protein